MKKWIHSATAIQSNANFKSTRGYGSKVKGDKRILRDVVDQIYDEVERRKLIDYFGNIKSAGKGYYIDWFRYYHDGWMLADTANNLADSINEVIQDLGLEDKAGVQLLKNSVESINERYGGQCYIVRVVVKDPLVLNEMAKRAETTNLIH